MRKSCYACVLKHLGSAGVFIKETKMGYPDYDIWVVGELEHAADECLRDNPELAAVIREHRLAWMDDHSHFIPFEALGRYVHACELSPAGNTPMPPEDTMQGLDVDGGRLHVSGDTRP